MVEKLKSISRKKFVGKLSFSFIAFSFLSLLPLNKVFKLTNGSSNKIKFIENPDAIKRVKQ